MFMTSFPPDYFPKAPPPNTTPLRVRVPVYEFWGAYNMHRLVTLRNLTSILSRAVYLICGTQHGRKMGVPLCKKHKTDIKGTKI